MRDVIYQILQLLTTFAKLPRPGASRTVIAVNLILKQQLIIHSRSRQRAPNLSTQNRALLGFWSLFLNPRGSARSAIVIKLSTLLRFHNALENKLQAYQSDYNKHRTHSGRGGTAPVIPASATVININEYQWQKHCRGLFQLPIAAWFINSPGSRNYVSICAQAAIATCGLGAAL